MAMVCGNVCHECINSCSSTGDMTCVKTYTEIQNMDICENVCVCVSKKMSWSSHISHALVPTCILLNFPRGMSCGNHRCRHACCMSHSSIYMLCCFFLFLHSFRIFTAWCLISGIIAQWNVWPPECLSARVSQSASHPAVTRGVKGRIFLGLNLWNLWYSEKITQGL